MSAPKLTDLSVRQRQSPVGILVNLFSLQTIQAFIPLLFLIGGAASSRWGIIGVPVGIFAILAAATIRWWRTEFWIEDDELRVERGLIGRESLQIPLDRVQQVATEQGIIQQIFSVVKVRVETAGAAGDELELVAVSNEVAEGLRRAVVGRDQHRFAAPDAAALVDADGLPQPAGAAAPFTPPRPDTVLLRQSNRDLVEVSVSSAPIGVILGAIGLGAPVFGFAADRGWFSGFEGIDASSIAVVIGIVAVALIVGALAIMLIVVATTVLTYYELTVWRTDSGLRLTNGLLQKREVFARTQRVQMVRWRQTLAERFLDRVTVNLPQASATATAAAASSAGVGSRFVVPGAPVEHLPALLEPFVANPVAPTRTISSKARWRWFLWGGIVPCVIPAVTAFGVSYWILLVIPAWLAYQWFATRGELRAWRWGIDERTFTVEHGWLTRHRSAIELRKVQSVHLRQGIWHRRNDLATVTFGLAGGAIKVLHLPVAEAEALRDRALYEVETSTGTWM